MVKLLEKEWLLKLKGGSKKSIIGAGHVTHGWVTVYFISDV